MEPRERSTPRIVAVPVLLALLGLGGLPAAAQGNRDRDALLREEYQRRLATQRVEAGERHLELGLECRRKGLTRQAAVEILRAVEVSEGRNEPARETLASMLAADGDFWPKRAAAPSRARLDAYERKAARVRRQDAEARLEVAAWAERKGLLEEAVDEFTALLRELDRALEVDGRGRIVTDVGRIPSGVSARILAEAVTINGAPHLRDGVLLGLPRSLEVFEVASEGLRVRSLTSIQEAGAFHRLGSALLPHLEEDLGGRPDRPPTLLLFPDRVTYTAAVEAAGLGEASTTSGVADNATLTALVCTEGNSNEQVASLALHELTHVFQHGVSPAVMPSWYVEGLADTWGGQGTFVWEDDRLEVGGIMSRHRLAPLLEPGGLMPLRDLLAADVLELWARQEAEVTLAFYAQSWAFLRFLRTGAGHDVAARLADWEDLCRARAVGARAGEARGRDASAARELFLERFGEDLEELEAAFAAWLREL